MMITVWDHYAELDIKEMIHSLTGQDGLLSCRVPSLPIVAGCCGCGRRGAAHSLSLAGMVINVVRPPFRSPQRCSSTCSCAQPRVSRLEDSGAAQVLSVLSERVPTASAAHCSQSQVRPQVVSTSKRYEHLHVSTVN